MLNYVARQYRKAILVIGLCLSVVSVANYLKTYLEQGFSGVIGKILDVYHSVLGLFLGWLDPYLRAGLSYLVECCHITLPFPAHWKDVFVPAFFYFAKDGFVYFDMKMPVAGLFSLFGGLVIALFASVLGGNLNDAPVESIWIFVIALALYEILCALYYAIFIGYKDKSWWNVFAYFFVTRVLTNVVLGLLVILVLLRNYAIPHIGPVLLLVYIAALGVRDIIVSVWVTFFQPREYEGQSAIHRLTHQGNWKLGVGVVVTIVAAVGLTVWSG